MDGSAAGIELGKSVAGAGDVNGDGFSDTIVGAPGFDNGQTDEGRALLFLGTANGLATTPAWTAEPNLINEHFGWSVAGAGDVNGDGYSDVIIGTNDTDDGNQERAFVYHGSPSGLAATPAWTGTIAQLNAGFGSVVAGAGDVNGDGFADVLVGAPRFDNGQADEGRSFVYLGSGSGLATNPIWTAESNQASSQFAAALSSAGDVNKDGFSDVLVGAPAFTNGHAGEGRAFLYLGGGAGPAAAPVWNSESDQINAAFGCAVTTAGDVNGDGFSDFAVGAKNYTANVAGSGRIYVLLGTATGVPSNPPTILNGNSLNGHLGQALGAAGDVNEDGYSDLIAGADVFFVDGFAGQGEGGGDNCGAVVYHGSASGVVIVPRWGVGDRSLRFALWGRGRRRGGRRRRRLRATSSSASRASTTGRPTAAGSIPMATGTTVCRGSRVRLSSTTRLRSRSSGARLRRRLHAQDARPVTGWPRPGADPVRGEAREHALRRDRES